MKNILIKLFQNRIIRVDYKEYKVLRYYNNFYFSNFIDKGKHIISDAVFLSKVSIIIGDIGKEVIMIFAY